jgi:hypothetical protein
MTHTLPLSSHDFLQSLIKVFHSIAHQADQCNFGNVHCPLSADTIIQGVGLVLQIVKRGGRCSVSENGPLRSLAINNLSRNRVNISHPNQTVIGSHRELDCRPDYFGFSYPFPSAARWKNNLTIKHACRIDGW